MIDIESEARKIVEQWVEHDLDEGLHSDYVGALQPELLQERIVALCGKVRKEAIDEVPTNWLTGLTCSNAEKKRARSGGKP